MTESHAATTKRFFHLFSPHKNEQISLKKIQAASRARPATAAAHVNTKVSSSASPIGWARSNHGFPKNWFPPLLMWGGVFLPSLLLALSAGEQLWCSAPQRCSEQPLARSTMHAFCSAHATWKRNGSDLFPPLPRFHAHGTQ